MVSFVPLHNQLQIVLLIVLFILMLISYSFFSFVSCTQREQFMAPTGLVFYLNTVTGDVVFEPPVPRPEVDLSKRSDSNKDVRELSVLFSFFVSMLMDFFGCQRRTFSDQSLFFFSCVCMNTVDQGHD
jgi:hypothetical protein